MGKVRWGNPADDESKDHVHDWVETDRDEDERRLRIWYRCQAKGCPAPNRDESHPKPGASPRNRPR